MPNQPKPPKPTPAEIQAAADQFFKNRSGRKEAKAAELEARENETDAERAERREASRTAQIAALDSLQAKGSTPQ